MLKSQIPLLSIVFSGSFLLAQEQATTESGKKIVIFPNGTWSNQSSQTSKADPKNQFNKPESSKTKISLLKGKASISYNQSLWKPVKQDDITRLQLQHRDGDGYVLIISERLQVPLNTLKEIALSNAKTAAPDAQIAHEETRTVNGVEVLAMQIKGTIQGIPFTYFGYYYSGKAGCLQMLTYTAQNLFEEYKTDFTDFLNGFILEQS